MKDFYPGHSKTPLQKRKGEEEQKEEKTERKRLEKTSQERERLRRRLTRSSPFEPWLSHRAVERSITDHNLFFFFANIILSPFRSLFFF